MPEVNLGDLSDDLALEVETHGATARLYNLLVCSGRKGLAVELLCAFPDMVVTGEMVAAEMEKQQQGERDA